MKRYVRSEADMSSYSSAEIEQRILDTLQSKGIESKVRNLSVDENWHGNFAVTLTMKPHGAKIKKTIRKTSVDSGVDDVCNSAYSYVTEGNKIPRSSAVLVRIDIGDVCFGYIRSIDSGRGEVWAYVTADPAEAQRFNSRVPSKAYRIIDIICPEYLKSDSEILIMHKLPSYITPEEVAGCEQWAHEHKRRTLHGYFDPDLQWTYTAVPIDSAVELSEMPLRTMYSCLLGYN